MPLDSEIAGLRAENERLRTASRRALAQWRDPHGENSYHQHAFERVLAGEDTE